MISERDGMEFGRASSLQLPFCPSGQTYTVVAGDTLFFISQRFGVCLQQLIEANPQIENPNYIFPGQIICIPAPVSIPEVPTPPCPTGLTYIVMPGDTLFTIAEQLGTTVDLLLQLNPEITDPNLLQAGDLLCVPLPVLPISPVPIPEPIEIEPTLPMPIMPCPPGEELPLPYIPEQPISMPQPYPYEPMPCPPEPVLPSPCLPEPVLPSPCPPEPVLPLPYPPEPALPLPCPEPVVPVMPAPYPYCPDPYIYATPMISWENCPYAPRRKVRRGRRRRRLFR